MSEKFKTETEQFVDTINKLRKENKDNWYSWSGMVNGQYVKLKGFNTWIQRIEVGVITDSGIPDISVKNFKEFLGKSVSRLG